MSHTLSSRIITYSLLILFGWALAAFYGFLGGLWQPGWFLIAWLHSVLALLVWRFGGRLRLPVRSGWIAYAPAAGVLISCVLAALTTRLWISAPESADRSWDARILAFVLWIPLVEEVVFRQGIGGFLRMRLGTFWGAYGSALLFAMAHSGATWGHLTMPIGPLLLGLFCEWIYAASGRLSAAIALHAACNASGWIFAALDPRWVDWLQALYLKV